MRARFALAMLAGCLSATAAAGGCQIISQLNDLQVGGSATGGNASSSASATASTATSTATSSSSTVASSTSTVASSSSTVTSSSSTASASSSSSSGACGDAGSPGCGGMCPTCTGSVCTPSCTSTCSTMIHTDMGPSAIQCNDSTSCVGKAFTCTAGMYLCELDCNVQGACTGNTTLQCGDGPCRLYCAGMGCGMGTTLVCGKGPCDVVYSQPGGTGGPPVPVQMLNCSESCDCTGHNNDTSGPAWMPPPPDAG